ncbi:MAG: BREX-6 system adenine-specific DNA-methyltransferase PglX [Polyangiaceae bacterium]|nr:BREX-6 system adenine-specific DNA-methyltransferase PglX [Polyangiaceae bacterium]
MATLTPEAKQLLSATIRGLRERLLRDLHDEAERRYHLSVPLGQAGLDEALGRRRARLDAWLDERVRASKARNDKERKAARERLLGQAVKEAGATLINRLVLLRHLEAMGLARPEIVTGGWASKGYQEFREFGPALLDDETEGYATLLQLVFDDLGVELPGLFGPVGLTELFPIPAATLREVIQKLDAKELESAWTDDTTLGWVYQYWNDPEREALDAKINDGGKIEPHEIASKTQMFTERYMVEWLLQNSLGLTWLSICKKNGWIPDAERVLPLLDARRADWRKKREAGEVALDALMPIEGELEDAWKYYVPQPIPEDAVAKAPNSIRDLKLLDPACGSGHFLVIAFDLLVKLYREEARHRGEEATDVAIAEAILANNLHGVDIDPRAIQIAAAALYLKAKTLAPKARPTRVNLVAPTLQLGNLPDDDPSLVELRAELKREAGIPEELTRRLVSGLAGVDHLGTLLKVDAAIEEALKATDLEFERSHGQGDLFGGFPQQQVKLSLGEAKATVLDKLEAFLARHSASEDLGLRLDGEQLAAGVRFVRLVKEGTYDVVVGNPPYQGTSRMADAGYVAKHYASAKADLYAAFMVRGVELGRPGALTGLVTMRGWMFLGQFAELRRMVLHQWHLTGIGDLGTGAFSSRSMDDVISTALVVLRNEASSGGSYGVQAGPLADPRRDAGKPARRQAALWAHENVYKFDPKGFEVIEGEPIVYWWRESELRDYSALPKLGDVAPVRQGSSTANNARFLRKPWEVRSGNTLRVVKNDGLPPTSAWVPYVMGASGRCWFEDLSDVLQWKDHGIELLVSETTVIRNPLYHFRAGVAYSTIGASFSARVHRYLSVFSDKGASVFPAPDQIPVVLCAMNRRHARDVLIGLNPTISFQVGDVNRLPVFRVNSAELIVDELAAAFTEHESAREPSVEFRQPGPSPWRYAQDWAQRAVDRPDGVPLPPYEPEVDPPAPESFVSFGLGVALGRFGASGEGILDEAPASALPAGILFVSTEGQDSLEHPACALLHEAWKEHGGAVGDGDDLRSYLRTSFFAYHKKLYENRPIYFPLSSAKKSYVAFVSIHRFRDDTLNVLLADTLVPKKRRLEGELDDLRKARAQSTTKTQAEKRFAEAQKLLEELGDFIDKVTQLAECGPPPPDEKTTKREVDARFVMDLDDGVMVNSAALWPLLEPQWKDPKKWWKELATAQGRKDYDWAHLAARYFPKRVRAKCVEDPSLAVAHHCFWELHPAKAYAWELRLQDEIKPEFTIDEPGSDEARSRFLKQHAAEAKEILASELRRRERKAAKADEDDAGPLFEQRGDGEAEDADG